MLQLLVLASERTYIRNSNTSNPAMHTRPNTTIPITINMVMSDDAFGTGAATNTVDMRARHEFRLYHNTLLYYNVVDYVHSSDVANNNIDFYLAHTHEIHINALYNTNKHKIIK